MRIAFGSLVRKFLASALALIASAGASLASTTVDCTSTSTALGTFFSSAVAAGTTVMVLGTCVGDVIITGIPYPGVTIEQAGGGGQIDGSLVIHSSVVYVNNITLDGPGDNDGIHVAGGRNGDAIESASSVFLNGVTIENFVNSGISIDTIGSVIVDGGSITGNFECGIFISNGADVQTRGPTIFNNGHNGSDTLPGDQCGVHVEDGATVTLGVATTIESNNGPALSISQATARIISEPGTDTLSSPSTSSLPTVVVRRGALDVGPDTNIYGTGHSNVIYATPGSTITMYGVTVSQNDMNDATVMIADGSTFLSLGANMINNSATNGIAISVSNASTFRQRNESSFMIQEFQDTITGNGSVQIESNMELGTGGTTPSSWTGIITVAQNSSLRMDGGITVTGAVKLTQASNGFFNISNGGQNIVTGGVSCPATTTPSAHVAGNTVVLTSSGGPSAVTIGTTPPNCLGF